MKSRSFPQAGPFLGAALASAVLALSLLAGALAAPAAMAAADGGGGKAHAQQVKKKAAAGKSAVHALKVGKTYTKYDATGDGKADKVTVKGTAPDARIGEGYYRRLTVRVNGKKVLTTKDSKQAYGIYPQVKLVNLHSGAALLYVHYSTSNGYYAGGWVYRCSSKGMKRIFDTAKLTAAYAESHPDAWRIGETLEGVSGKDLTFVVGSTTTDPVSYTCRYKGGKLVPSARLAAQASGNAGPSTASGGGGPRAMARPSAKKIRALYRKVLSAGGNSYAVYDVDANGIPELLVNSGSYEAEYEWAVYTVKGGKAKRLGEFPGTHATLLAKPGRGHLCSWQAAMGYSTLYRVTVRKGRAVSRTVVKEGPYADLNGMPKTSAYKKKHKLKALKCSPTSSYALLNKKV